jgi:hypothetical protein
MSQTWQLACAEGVSAVNLTCLAVLVISPRYFCHNAVMLSATHNCSRLSACCCPCWCPCCTILQNVSSAIAPDLSTYFTLTDLNAFRTSRAAINATFAALQRRLGKLDPWLPVDTQVTSGGFYPLASDGGMMMPPQASAVDVSDAAYLAGRWPAVRVMACCAGLRCYQIRLSSWCSARSACGMRSVTHSKGKDFRQASHVDPHTLILTPSVMLLL